MKFNSSRFPFVMTVMLMGLLIMPPYVNTQFTVGSNIAKLPCKVVPIHKNLQLLNINELEWKSSRKPNRPIHFSARYK